MDNKNHSQNFICYQDYKSSPTRSAVSAHSSRAKLSSSNFYLAGFLVLLILASGYYLLQQGFFSKADSQQPTVSSDPAHTGAADTDADSTAFTPLDLDNIENHGTGGLIAAQTANNSDAQNSESFDENWINVEIQKGDSLSKIFERLNLSSKEAIKIASNKQTKSLNYLTVGRELAIKTDAANNFLGLEYKLNKLKSLVVNKDSSGKLITETHEQTPVVRIRDVSTPIRDNLFNTAKHLKISRQVVSELSSIFRWDIDFARDIQDGDRFSVIYQEKLVDGELMSTGDILAAEFIIDGEVTRAIRHETDEGIVSYYTPEGKSLKKAFLRNPMDFVNITSGFTKRRYHPIKKKWRAHKGVDYGAPKGTPIKATADGRIERIGRAGAYGNSIVLDHGQGYSTLYAHMSRFNKGIHNGAKVKQGQIIGFVGSTGLSTGNHLHYEFRINGTHVDPLAVKLPRSLPIDSKEMKNFIAESEKWVRRLDALQGQTVADSTSLDLTPPSI